jgi:hypothetical protein
MNTYEVHFLINGVYYKEQITTANSLKARELIKKRYPNAKIMSAKKVK